MSNLDEQYRKLEQTRMILNPRIITSKKDSIKRYFRNFQDVDLTNLEQKIKDTIILYRAPLIQIHGSNMTNWPTNNGDDIYIDINFLTKRENDDIIKHQLTHEVMHSLCRRDNKKMMFGHEFDKNSEYLRGINEAVTQIFTDDIENKILSQEEDYLYFVKNIMRVIKNLIGSSLLINQYLNNDMLFEEKFNEFTDNNFEDFAFIMNQIYKLSKEKYYRKITLEEVGALSMYQDLILEFTNSLIKEVGSKEPGIYARIKEDFFNKDFLNRLVLN